MKYIELFKDGFDETITEKIKPENYPYVGYDKINGKLAFTDLTKVLDIFISDTEDENSAVLTEENRYGIGTISIGRSLVGGMMNSLTLPFDLTSLENTPLEGSKVLKFSGVEDGGKLIFNELSVSKETPMLAGYPYVIEPTSDIVGPLSFNNVKLKVIKNDECYTESFNNYTIVGIITPTALQSTST